MKKILIILCLIFPANAFAEIVTLEQVIQKSLQKNSGIYRAQREYDDRMATAKEVRLFDNPELNADAIHEDGNFGTDLELTQPLKFSQLSGSRAYYSELLSKTAGIEQQYEILKVINETTVLYTQVWLLSERKKLYEKYAADAEKMQNLVNASSRQGQTSPAAASLFSSDAYKLRADASSVDAELRQARIQLTKLTGKNYQDIELQRPVFSNIPEDLDKLLTFAKSRANLRNVLKTRIEAAKQRLNIAKQDALPEFGPRLLYSNSPDRDENSYGIGVALKIPLWNRNDGERKRAEAELKQAKLDSDLFTGLPQSEIINELSQSASVLQSRSESYFNNILPGYRKSYELTGSMFRQGQANALEVWQVREKLLASENEALDAVIQSVNARGVLELELGGKLEEVQ